MTFRLAVGLMLAALLSGCSLSPEKPVADYQLAERQYLQQQRQWAFEGRLAVADDKDSVTVSISWRHDERKDDIELVGPLAQGRVKILVNDGQVEIDDGETRNVYHGEPEAVVTEQLGVDMPVSALRYWVLGVNAPQPSYVEQQGGFYQSGWLVRYREMQKVDANWLPKKITAEKDKARIKLIVDQWNLS